MATAIAVITLEAMAGQSRTGEEVASGMLIVRLAVRFAVLAEAALFATVPINQLVIGKAAEPTATVFTAPGRSEVFMATAAMLFIDADNPAAPELSCCVHTFVEVQK